jgi:hypothetical protein
MPYFIIMTRRTGKNKVHSSPTPTATKAKKELFIKALAAGDAPGCAAAVVDIARSTAYEWKKQDAAFSAEWDNAVETSLDKLETALYSIGKDDRDVNAIMNTLKYRRKHLYCSTEDGRASQTNFILSLTYADQCKRLERLGLPVPVIEGDCIEDDHEDASARTDR